MSLENVLRPLRPVEGAAIHMPNIVSPLGPRSQNHAPIITGARGMAKRTCLQCRVRKVKCDGQQGTCGNCERLEFDCSFGQSPGYSTVQNGFSLPERRRRMQACLACRNAKTKCLGELPECSNCSRKGLACSYPVAKKRPVTSGPYASGNSPKRTERTTSAEQESPAGSIIDGGITMDETSLSHGTLVELAEDYFRHLYPMPSYAFLHRATVMQRCQDGTIDTALKLALCATTALQLQRSVLCHDLWIQQAEQILLQQLGHPTIFHLQALLLVIRYRIESGAFPTAFMLAALAGRSAVALRLNYERSELSALAQEARRRLFWSLFLLDDFFCVGIRDFEIFPQETIHLQLPCCEEFFEAGQYYRTGGLEQDSSEMPATIGLRGLYLRLVSIRREIMRFVRRVDFRELNATTMLNSIRRFEHQLRLLHSGMSQSEIYSVTNLANCPLQAQFIMLHVSWHQCYCDLYRLFLNGYAEAAPTPIVEGIHFGDRITMRHRCIEHAESIFQIMSDFWNYGNRHAYLERDTAVCAFEAARIVLFTASNSVVSGPTLEPTIKKANLCLEMMSHFFFTSASVKPIRDNFAKLISSYTARLALQHKEALREPYTQEPPTSMRISQYANSRQKLSVQSLLLQSNFVDDSDEITLPPLRYDRRDSGVGMASVSEHNNSLPLLPSVEGIRTPNRAYPVAESNIEYELNIGGGGGFSTGSAFNPWMGFPGQDEVYNMYGQSGHLNQDF